MQKGFFSSANKFYIAYRKIRFLASRGTLFSLPRQNQHDKTEFPKGTFRIISLNSVFLFLLGYMIVYLLHLFITAFVAMLFDIPVVVYYHDVDFIIRGNDWTTDMVTGVFSAGPISMLVLAILLLILYVTVSTETGILRLLVLWMIFHALTRFFGELLVGAVMGKGFGYVILYMFVMDTGKVILSILVFVMMFTIGLLLFQLFLFSANIYFNDLRKSYRFRFLTSQFLVPFLIGNIAILLIKIPSFSYFDATLNATGLLILIPLFVRSVSFQDMYFDEDQRTINIRVGMIALTIILLTLFR
ncbi:MAG: hypothetical protein WCK34_04180, partial [Bacteroidota bacterium]